MYMCMYTYIHTHIYICNTCWPRVTSDTQSCPPPLFNLCYIYIYIYTYISLCICMYIYISLYIYTYIYIYICICCSV